MNSEFSSLPERKLDELHIKLLRAIQNDPEFMNTTRLSEVIDKAVSTTSDRLNKLEQNEYIVKDDEGKNNYYGLRDRGRNFLQTMDADSEMLDRSHGLMFTFPIKRNPSEGFCDEDFRVNENMTNWSQKLRKDLSSNIALNINGDSSISIAIKQVYGRNSRHAVLIGYFLAEDAIRELIQDYPKLVVGKSGEGCIYPCRISKQSHAIRKDLFAKKAAEFNLHLSKKDTGGNFEVDRSHGIPEIEFTDPQSGVEDYEKYVNFVNSILDGSISVEALERITNLVEKSKQS